MTEHKVPVQKTPGLVGGRGDWYLVVDGAAQAGGYEFLRDAVDALYQITGTKPKKSGGRPGWWSYYTANGTIDVVEYHALVGIN